MDDLASIMDNVFEISQFIKIPNEGEDEDEITFDIRSILCGEANSSSVANKTHISKNERRQRIQRQQSLPSKGGQIY